MNLRSLAPAAGAVLLALALALGFWWARSPRATRVRVGMAAPDVELAWAEPGRSGRLSEFRGSPVLLGYYDTTAPGLVVGQALEAVQRRFRRRDLVVVGVALDDRRTPVLNFLRGQAISFMAFHDPEGARTTPLWGRPQVGEAYLIDAGGKVIRVYPSRFRWPDPDLQRTLLGVLPPERPGPR